MQNGISHVGSFLNNSDENDQGEIGLRKVSVKTRSTKKFKDLENLINEANNVMDELKGLNN